VVTDSAGLSTGGEAECYQYTGIKNRHAPASPAGGLTLTGEIARSSRKGSSLSRSRFAGRLAKEFNFRDKVSWQSPIRLRNW